MSKNSIEFSLSNSEQRDSWLNSSHRTLDADNYGLARIGNSEVFFVSLSLLSFCFVIIIKYSRAQEEKSIIPPSSSLSVALELNGYSWVTEFLVFLSVLASFLKNPPKFSLDRNSSPNGLGHSLMLGVNSSLRVIGVGFQLYGQLKKSPHDVTGEKKRYWRVP